MTGGSSYFNVTIKNFTNNYKYNILCSYGGVIFYEEEKRIYKEKRLICFDNGYFYKHRNIYSSRSEMLLLMYAYKGYGTLFISLNISTTQCRLSLRKKLCTYDFYCSTSPRNYHGYGGFKNLCKQFLNESVTEAKAIGRVDPHKVISHEVDNCLIYQFTQEVNLYLYKIVTFIQTSRYSATTVFELLTGKNYRFLLKFYCPLVHKFQVQ